MYTCTACRLKFKSESLFNKHRVGKYIDVPPDYGRKCLSVTEIINKGLIVTDGVVSQNPNDPTYIRQLESLKLYNKHKKQSKSQLNNKLNHS